jgi:hypothetical protein
LNTAEGLTGLRPLSLSDEDIVGLVDDLEVVEVQYI